MRASIRNLAIIALTVASCSYGTVAPAHEEPSAPQSEDVESQEDHHALAKEYAEEAAEFRSKAEEHRVMLGAYENGPRYQKVRKKQAAMIKHCRRLIDEYTAAAEEAEALSREHRVLAGEAPGKGGVEKAESAGKHDAIADEYEKEAAELRKRAEKHRVMIRAYENAPSYQKLHRKARTGVMVRHCQRLIDRYTAGAEAAEALAREHRSLARE